ncbi:hypothetical protein DUNSADRAFT_2787 [Dunaliella salina]|uniref:Encoded protein n=1 Tax=Dunaliella salina TaxID=3046 RepID=A0ABQ7FVY0_DUNSA|nr:hypothetical protein DUNSADRAFT_2787 [Dunaliella salina]|eukprot:KAF5826540.1 hypothetical protein DUNSADRAFT_2787 [Dunaliella salina]
MQFKAGHKIEQPSAEGTDVENAVLQAGSSSQSKAHDDPPCNQTESAAGLLTLTCKFPHLLIGPGDSRLAVMWGL